MRKADKQKEFPKGLLQFALAMGSNQLYGAVSQVNVKPEFGLPGDAIIDSDATILPHNISGKDQDIFFAYATAFAGSQLYGANFHINEPHLVDDNTTAEKEDYKSIF